MTELVAGPPLTVRLLTCELYVLNITEEELDEAEEKHWPLGEKVTA